MATITKREVAERVAKKTGQPQLAVKQIIQVFFDEVIADMIQGNRLEFRDFGVFEVIKRKPRTGRNPKTGQKVGVPAKRVVTFKMGKLMKERVASLPPEEAAEAAPAQVAPAPAQPPGASSSAL
ncbi:MAG TPA: HU family DNA-binding protein [Candidatus Brocadiia bacterium]|nr:HU family DNA-binding protein [Candidatus Brocadiia bacterium]